VDDFEAGQKLRGDVLSFLEIERASLLKYTQQRRPIDVLHRYQLNAPDLDQIKDPADVGRHHLAGGPDTFKDRSYRRESPQKTVRFLCERYMSFHTD